MKLAAAILALSIAPAAAQALDPPPAFWDIAWRADIYVRGAEPLENANIVDFDRMSSPGFTSLRSCQAYGYSSAVKMADLISAYFNDADVSIRWTCGRP